MKFESIKNNSQFGSFEKSKISNLNAICGGYLIVTVTSAKSKSEGKSGDDVLDTDTGKVSDEINNPGTGINMGLGG